MYTTTVFKIPSRLSAVWEHPFWETKENIVQDREPSDYLTSFVIRETGACRFAHSRLVWRTYPILQTLGWLISWVATRSGYSTRDGAVRLGKASEETMLLMLAWQHLLDTINKGNIFRRYMSTISSITRRHCSVFCQLPRRQNTTYYLYDAYTIGHESTEAQFWIRPSRDQKSKERTAVGGEDCHIAPDLSYDY